MALVPYNIAEKIFTDLESKGFSPEWWNDEIKDIIKLENTDGLLGIGGLRGWQIIELHNTFSQYDCDFKILNIIDGNLCIELLTAKETVEGYDFNYIEQYCK